MVNKKRVVISIDPEIHRQSVTILKESGVKFSTFIEIVAKGIVEGETKTFNDMFQSMTKSLIEQAISVHKTKRRQ